MLKGEIENRKRFGCDSSDPRFGDSAPKIVLHTNRKRTSADVGFVRASPRHTQTEWGGAFSASLLYSYTHPNSWNGFAQKHRRLLTLMNATIPVSFGMSKCVKQDHTIHVY
jgi:hypothetical protein